ncbi:MAG: hypothetical protein ACLTVY_06820 [Faecalibacterium sp.]
MLLSFDGWHRWQDILRLAHLVVTSRHVGDDPELHAKALRLDPTGARILFAPVQALPMASSDIRARLTAGEGCEAELPEAVRGGHPPGEALPKRGKYQPMNLKQAKELVRGRLSDKRYEHTLNVRKMAVKLAKIGMARMRSKRRAGSPAARLRPRRSARMRCARSCAAYPRYWPRAAKSVPAPVWHGVCAAILARTQWGVDRRGGAFAPLPATRRANPA